VQVVRRQGQRPGYSSARGITAPDCKQAAGYFVSADGATTKAESFAPIYTRNVFWVAQVFPLLALIGFAGWKIRRARIDNREAQRIAALQHESD